MIAPIPFLGRSDADPKWKQFCNAIERALANWDQVAEWADYIAFLSKLLKALSSRNSSFNHIPQSEAVARRLSQCLDPSLPSGVHQKTLEVYTCVFDILKDTLHTEICMWLPGLLPVMSYSSINVKPRLISLFDNYILPLPGIRGLTKPLLLSFLPGIDDESSETFDQVYLLITNLRQKTNDDSHFWQCLYLCVISSHDRRLGALVYISRELPQFNAVENTDSATEGKVPSLSKDAQAACSPDPGLLIRSLCRGIQDSHVLVQRGFLDVLVRNLNLQSPVLQDLASKSDVQMLVMCACSTLLSRDMSLNRRLWMWVLGPNDSNSGPASQTTEGANTNLTSNYFQDYAMSPLIDGLLSVFQETHEPVTPQPFRIALYLLDRWEVASYISEKVFIPALRAVYQSYKREDVHFKEVLRSASAFFDGVEAMYIWGQIHQLIMENDLDLVEYVINVFNVREEDMCSVHVPLILLVLVSRYHQSERDQWLRLCRTLIDLVPGKALDWKNSEDDSDSLQLDQALESIDSHYKTYSHLTEPTQGAGLPIPSHVLVRLLVDRLCSLASSELESCSQNCGLVCGLLATTLDLIDLTEEALQSLALESMVSHLTSFPYVSLDHDSNTREFSVAYSDMTGIIDLFETIQPCFTYDDTNSFVYGVVKQLFYQCADSYEPVAGLWRLQHILNDHRVDSALASTWTSSSRSSFSLQSYLSLQSIWKGAADRPDHELLLESIVFLALEGLHSSSDKLAVTHWLATLNSESAMDILLDMIVARIERNVSEADLNQALYAMGILVVTLEASSSADRIYRKEYSLRIVTAILRRPTVGTLEYLEQLLPESKSELNLIAETLIGFLEEYSSGKASSFASVEVLSCLRILAKTLVSIDSLPNEKLEALMRVCILSVQKRISPIEASSWTDFFADVLPLYQRHQVLAPVVKPLTIALCSASLKDLKLFPAFADALENLLASTHSASRRGRKGHEHKASFDPSFFTNVISGVFSVEGPEYSSTDPSGAGNVSSGLGAGAQPSYRSGLLSSPSPDASQKNILVECFEHVVNCCFNIWSNQASPIRARARKLLTRLYFLEPKVTLEYIVESDIGDNASKARLLHSLDSSRPKFTVPHILNAVGDDNLHVAEFMCEYLTSLDDDAVEEIWPELMAFLRELLQNWSQFGRNRAVYAHLLRSLGIVGLKVNNARFGDQRRARKDLSETFAKILTLILTDRKKYYSNGVTSASPSSSTKSSPMVPAVSSSLQEERERKLSRTASTASIIKRENDSEFTIEDLIELVPVIPSIVPDVDRRNTLLTSILGLVVSPAIKRFQSSPDYDMIPSLLNEICIIPQSDKTWKNIVGDWLFDPKFSQQSPEVAGKWVQVISRWSACDRDRIKEHVQKIANASLFGWTEESSIQARNLDRLAYIFLCDGLDESHTQVHLQHQRRFSGSDSQAILGLLNTSGSAANKSNAFALNMKDMMAKFEAVTINLDRVFDCLRAVVLSVSSELLAPVWTFIYSQVYTVLQSIVMTEEQKEKDIDLKVITAACKLLDVILLLNPEDFLVCEWLFICDNMDAIFSRDERDPIGIVDVVSQSRILSAASHKFDASVDGKRKPLLYKVQIRKLQDLKPFFDQLSMYIYEGQYALTPVDIEACRHDLLCDLFE